MKKTFIPFCLLLFGLGLAGQNFEVTVSSDSVLLGNYIEVNFKVENVDGQFEAPTSMGMDVISGPNTSSSVQIINGERNSSSTYSYYLKPSDVGSYTLPPAYFITDDKTLETTPIVINVYPNPENIIIEPRMAEDNFFFDFDNFSPFSKPRHNTPPTPPETPAKPKRKYKRI